MIPEPSNPKKIMHHCLLVNDYLQTIKKSIVTDSENVDGFTDHYSDLIEMAIALNWRNHNVAESISFEDFRRNQKID